MKGFIIGVLITIIIYAMIYHWSNDVTIETFEGINPGKKILIIGSVHGNEPAGGIALDRLVEKLKQNKPNRGKIIIIRRPNKLGFIFNSRYLIHRITNRDLNRNFPRITGELPLDPISEKICNVVDECDFILDFHEGWGWANHSTSLGSGLYPSETQESIDLSDHIKNSLNSRIENKMKKWIMRTNSHSELNSLRSYCCLKRKHYILVETTGQENVQNIEIRVRQNLYIMDQIFKKYRVFNIYV